MISTLIMIYTAYRWHFYTGVSKQQIIWESASTSVFDCSEGIKNGLKKLMEIKNITHCTTCLAVVTEYIMCHSFFETFSLFVDVV